MKRTPLGLALALAAFAAGLVAANAYERAVAVPADLVPAPAVEELRSTPAPQPLTCQLHGFEMRPVRVGFETVAVYSQNWQYAVEESRSENERRFPNYSVIKGAGEKDEYDREVYLLYRCDRCDAAYRAWDRRHASELEP